LGEKISTLIDEFKTAGSYTLELNANSLKLSSGVYLIKFLAVDQESRKDFSRIIKIVLNK